MSRKIKTCVYCVSAEGRSADHIPPKAIFTKPRPRDLVTVPACTDCNTSFKANDEYFAAMLALRTGVLQSRQGRRLLAQVTRGLRHPKGQRFREMITANWMKAEDLPKEYGPVDGPYVYWANIPRLRATAERIVRGLHYHCYRATLDPHTTVRAALLEELPRDIRTLTLAPLYGEDPVELADGCFAFCTKRARSDEQLSVWLLTFYADASFVVLTGPSPKGKR